MSNIEVFKLSEYIRPTIKESSYEKETPKREWRRCFQNLHFPSFQARVPWLYDFEKSYANDEFDKCRKVFIDNEWVPFTSRQQQKVDVELKRSRDIMQIDYFWRIWSKCCCRRPASPEKTPCKCKWVINSLFFKCSSTLKLLSIKH